MRVGLFTESYDPVINGVSASVKTLGLELCREGHLPVVVAPRFPGYDDPPDDLTVARIPSWRSRWNPQNPFAYPPLGPVPAALRAQVFDVAHTQQPFGMGQHGRRIARRLNVPLVSTFHTLYTEYIHYFQVVPRPVALWWVTGQLRSYYATCDRIIVPSREAGRRLTLLGIPGERQVIVPTGIPVAAPVSQTQKADARQRFNVPQNVPVILFVGRVAREKNLDVLLDAFADLCLTGSDAHLLIVGSGPYLTACQTRARQQNLTGRVHFAGFIPREELGPFYSLADVFAFPSATETQGMVVAEAQSYGLPCVVASVGGAAELVRNGIDALVTPPDAIGFAFALNRLLTDANLRAKFAQCARDNPLRPTPSDMARMVVSIYDDARAHRSRQAG